jgi:hypothetical protein
MYRKTLIGLIAGAVALSSFGVAFAVAQASQQQQQPAAPGEATASEEVDGRMRCNGGQHRLHRSIISDTPVQWNEATGTVGLGTIRYEVPKGRDTVEVDVNAETRLYGASDDGHWIQLNVYLDGRLTNPNDGVSPTALANDGEGWESNSTTVCQRVGEGKHTVRVEAQLVDFYNSADLEGWLDDWTFELDVYE